MRRWTLYESDEVEVAAVEQGNTQDKDASYQRIGSIKAMHRLRTAAP